MLFLRCDDPLARRLLLLTPNIALLLDPLMPAEMILESLGEMVVIAD